ncbi:hypothetical protein PQX77_016044 [Marasmius sp. AFHP31]|nr:hypothetical protein PQX77_016044 [Marasmius sp. AFHP31]
MQTHQDTKSQKSESTTSLIPKDTKTNEDSPSTSTQTTGKTGTLFSLFQFYSSWALTTSLSDSQTSPSTSNAAGVSTTAVPTGSFVDFAQKAKNNGWGAPTPTMPNLGA